MSELLANMGRCFRTALSGVLLFLRSNFPSFFPYVDVSLLSLCDVCRLCVGRWRAKGVQLCARPPQPLKLYEYEGCPYCKKVREALCVLDLDYMVYPCPRETLMSYGICLYSRYRPEVKQEGGAIMFPFLVDPNKNVKLYNSDEIVKYLWDNYGDKATRPLNYRIANWELFRNISLYCCGLLRPCVDMGILRAGSKKPKEALELWGYEGSAFVKRVRETLTMLETPYLMHVIPFGSEEKRNAFKAAHKNKLTPLRQSLGIIQVPFLKDPNTGVELFESADIVKYLQETYKTGDVPPENWCNFGSGDKRD